MKLAEGTASGEESSAEAVEPKNRPSSVEAVLSEIKNTLGEAWPPQIYRQRVLPMRTRSHRLAAAKRNASVEILHTLLGIELKVGRRRIACPDLATARYLAVFAHIGCTEVAVPYDITQISRLADDLESAWHRMLLLSEHSSEGRKPAIVSKVRTKIIAEARREIEQAGAGTPVPQFNQNTKQRQRRL
ncbi:MAG TPA: hypothetical protein VM866_07520 [Pyrinomonadaceae bacterium]|jgi:hypothetical protein|nr:hypothetical protein [Pyrinomonadaceae bacterium]